MEEQKNERKDGTAVRRIVLGLIVLVFALTLAANARLQTATSDDAGGGPVVPSWALGAKTFPLDPNGPLPTVDFDIHQSSGGGWDVHVITQNFAFTPENAGRGSVAGQGFAELFVDGGSPYVIYGPWYHMSAMSRGTHAVAVALVGDDRSFFTVQGEYVQAVKTVMQE